MSCDRCNAACQGALCRQCEVYQRHQHLADELARADDEAEADDD